MYDLYIGVDQTGREFLLTVWADGTHEIATRMAPFESWGRPLTLTRQIAEVSG